jgi:hypothetical protein
MKKILPALFVCLSASAFACGGDSTLYPKWSIGVIGVGSIEMPLHGAHTSFLPGVQFTYSKNGTWAQRVAVEHTRYAAEAADYPAGGADMMSIEGTAKRTVLRIGLQNEWALHRFFHPYAALDLAGQLSESNMVYTGGIAGINERREISTKGIGVIPALGFKTFFGKRIALYGEYRAEGFLNAVDTKTFDYRTQQELRATRISQLDFRSGDLFLAGIQVMF